MPIMFNTLLEDVEISPADVRLIRHAPTDHRIVLARDLVERRAQFEQWQQFQFARDRAHFDSPYWAVFIALPDGRSQFVQLYKVQGHHVLATDQRCDLTGDIDHAEVVEQWQIEDSLLLSEFETPFVCALGFWRASLATARGTTE